MEMEITSKKFIQTLADYVKNGVISEKQKMDYEITCAYTQLENPSQLQQKMISILKEIENARKS